MPMTTITRSGAGSGSPDERLRDRFALEKFSRAWLHKTTSLSGLLSPELVCAE